jgi:hypothetical protein
MFHVKPAIQKLQSAYEQVINSLIDKSIIPYYPNIYPVRNFLQSYDF